MHISEANSRCTSAAADRLASLAMDEPQVSHYWRSTAVTVAPCETGLFLASVSA